MSKIWKKLLAVALTASISAGAAVAGTVAYLQDTDEDVNVMTLGSVKIDQHEYQRKVDADGKFVTDTIDGVTSYVLEGFKQMKPLMPATEVDANGNPYNYGAGDYDATRVKMAQVGSHGSMDVFVNPNAQDKFVTVENTGKSDAYVRTLIAFEIGGLTEAEFDNIISTSSFMTEQGVWKVTDIGIVEIDDNNYYLCEYLYNGAKALGGVHENGVLPAGDTTYPSLAQVYMTAAATNEDMEKIDGNNNGLYDILVLSQAVQATGFDTAVAALTAGFGAATEENVKAWFSGEEFETPVTVASNAELDAAIAGGASTIVLGSGNYIIPDSAQGKELTIIGNGETVIATQDDGSYEGCDYSLDGSTVTFDGVVINTDSTTYTGYARLNATYNNCTINGTYTLYGDSVFNNCTFNVSGDVYNIWTWGAPTATFNNCTFNSDGKALLLYGTVNTKLTVNGCTFNDKGGLTDLKAAIEIGNDYNKSYELIVNNTTVNGYEINDKGINTGTTLWGNKNSMGTDKLNVVVDGVDVY